MAIDWGRARKIFDRAVEMNPAERPVFLAEVCGDDLELRLEVEELLLANDQAGDFLAKPATPALVNPPTQEETLKWNSRRISQYQMLRELGRGGMGVVYLAVRADGEYQKQVAIKVLQPGVDPRLAVRFRQERQILADLEHPNIARLIDGGTSDGMPYVVMEYVEGHNLRSILKERGPLPLDDVVDIAKQVCAGLDAAHQQGVIHRDIKPENLIVAEKTSGMLVKILDFGIARMNIPEASTDRTQTGVILGTATYMSPEQAAGATHEQIDARADVYSLGMVIYEMLTGRVAFEGDTVLAIINQHLREKPIPPSRLRPDLNIPKEIERAVLKALEKDRGRRQQTVNQLAKELEAASGQAAVSISPKPRHSYVPYFVALIVTALALSLAVFWAAKFQLVPGRPSNNQSQQAMPSVSPAAAGAKNISLQYRIIRRSPDGEVKTLASKDALHKGDQIHFEFVMPFEGSFYLFYENKDGSMVWANPTHDGSPQVGTAKSLARVPGENEIPMGDGSGPQNFLAVYVPTAAQWSLKEVALPDKIKIRLGDGLVRAHIPSTIAAGIKNNLDQNAVSVTFPSNQFTDYFTQQLNEPLPPTKLLFHRITLNQEP